MNKLLSILSFAAIIFLASCKGYSKYPISEKGTINVKEEMFGIWKAVGDTNTKNYILIQSFDDTHYTVAEIRKKYGSVKRYVEYVDSFMYTGSDLPMPKVDTISEIEEITKSEKENEPIKNFTYWVTRFTNNGRNPNYQQWHMHSDKIGDDFFITCNYWHVIDDKNNREEGYIFYRMLSMSKDSLTVCVIADPTMKDLKSSKEVKDKIIKNINNRSFYSDTVRLYKVKDGHFGLNESMELANK